MSFLPCMLDPRSRFQGKMKHRAIDNPHTSTTCYRSVPIHCPQLIDKPTTTPTTTVAAATATTPAPIATLAPREEE